MRIILLIFVIGIIALAVFAGTGLKSSKPLIFLIAGLGILVVWVFTLKRAKIDKRMVVVQNKVNNPTSVDYTQVEIKSQADLDSFRQSMLADVGNHEISALENYRRHFSSKIKAKLDTDRLNWYREALGVVNDIVTRENDIIKATKERQLIEKRISNEDFEEDLRKKELELKLMELEEKIKKLKNPPPPKPKEDPATKRKRREEDGKRMIFELDQYEKKLREEGYSEEDIQYKLSNYKTAMGWRDDII